MAEMTDKEKARYNYLLAVLMEHNDQEYQKKCADTFVEGDFEGTAYKFNISEDSRRVLMDSQCELFDGNAKEVSFEDDAGTKFTTSSPEAIGEILMKLEDENRPLEDEHFKEFCKITDKANTLEQLEAMAKEAGVGQE